MQSVEYRAPQTSLGAQRHIVLLRSCCASIVRTGPNRWSDASLHHSGEYGVTGTVQVPDSTHIPKTTVKRGIVYVLQNRPNGQKSNHRALKWPSMTIIGRLDPSQSAALWIEPNSNAVSYTPFVISVQQSGVGGLSMALVRSWIGHASGRLVARYTHWNVHYPESNWRKRRS
jgi:hypothetical protein